MRLWYRLWRLVVSMFCHLLWWPRLEGREHCPEGPCLICLNHRSWFDPPIVGSVIRWREIGFLAKSELFANPLAGWILTSWSVRPIRRGMIDRAAVGHVRALLERNIPVVVFPEGTRSRTGRMQAPRPGVGRLARIADVPVLPVYISGTFGIGRKLFRWGCVNVRIGPPISLQELRSFSDDKDGYRALSRHIMERICDLSDDPDKDRMDAFSSSDRTATAQSKQ